MGQHILNIHDDGEQNLFVFHFEQESYKVEHLDPASPTPVKRVVSFSTDSEAGFTKGTFGYQLHVSDQYDETDTFRLPSDVSTVLPLTGFSNVLDRLQEDYENHDFIEAAGITGRADDDTFLLRLNCKAKCDLAGGKISAQVDVGGDDGVISSADADHHVEAGEEKIISFLLPMFTKQTFLANSATIKLKSFGGCDLWDFEAVVFPWSRA